jgi:hypothetical protein
MDASASRLLCCMSPVVALSDHVRGHPAMSAFGGKADMADFMSTRPGAVNLKFLSVLLQSHHGNFKIKKLH